MKYYTRLQTRQSNLHGTSEAVNLIPPAHVREQHIPSYIFGVRGSQSDKDTVLSMANTMMGSTLLALPWAYYQSGMVLGIGITLLMGAVSCYTCLLVIDKGLEFDDYTLWVRHFLGAHAQWMSWVMSILVILGAGIAYHILLEQTLFSIVNAIYEWGWSAPADSSPDGWTPAAAALTFLVLYPVACLRDMKMLVKVNSLGAIFLFYVLSFIVYHGVHAAATHGINIPPAAAAAAAIHDHNSTAVSTVAATAVESLALQDVGPGGKLDILYNVGFSSLAGTVTLSYFIHNAVHPILRHANPASRRKNVMRAFAVVGCAYVTVGSFGLFGFLDAAADKILTETRFQQNFLTIFDTTDLYAFTARVALLLQLVTVYPLLLLIIRHQVMTVLYGDDYPSRLHVASLNAGLMAVTTSVAIFYPRVGDVLRFTGALGGAIIMFGLPVIITLSKAAGGDDLPLRTKALRVALALLSLLVLVLQFIPTSVFESLLGG